MQKKRNLKQIKVIFLGPLFWTNMIVSIQLAPKKSFKENTKKVAKRNQSGQRSGLNNFNNLICKFLWE